MSCGCHDPGVFGHLCRGGRQSSEPPFLGQPMGPPVWLVYAMGSGAAGMVRGEIPRQGSIGLHETNRRAGQVRGDIR